MNNSNLLVAVNFNLTASTKVFNFTDTSNYTGVTASAKYGNLKAVAPNGTTFHNNTAPAGASDIVYSVSPTSANFPLTSILVGGKLPTGSYVFTYTMTLEDEQQNVPIASNNSGAATIELAGNWVSKITDSSATAFSCIDTLATTALTIVSATYNSSTNYTTVTVVQTLGPLTANAIFRFTVDTVAVNTFTQAYTYVSPTPCLSWVADDCCSSMTITDVTAYPAGVTITRLHTVHYPDGMLIPIANITSPLQAVTISPIWTGTWTDTFTASFSSTNGLITILDALRTVDEFLVSGNAEECQIYSCLTNITNKYAEALITAPSYAINTLQPLLIKALALLNAYQLGKKCGETSCTTYLSQITTIANSCGCSCDCLDCTDNTPVQVVGCCGLVAGSTFQIQLDSAGLSIIVTANVGTTSTLFNVEVSGTWFDARFLTRMNATSIDALIDVNTTSVVPTAGQALVWNSGSSKWVPGTVASSVTTLSDVNATGLANNMVMYFDGSVFRFKLLTYALNDLTDVIIATATTNDILKYNGTNWINAQNLLLSLADVNAGSIADNQSIKWDTATSKFIPYTPATALTGLSDVDITTASLVQSNILMWDAGSGKWINQAKAVYANVPLGSFNSGVFDGTVSSGDYYSVATKYNILDGSLSIRGVAHNLSPTPVVTGTKIFTIPNVLPIPAHEIPFLCTVGLGGGSPTVGGGAIIPNVLLGTADVSIYWYIDPVTNTRLSGYPVGDIDLGQIPSYFV